MQIIVIAAVLANVAWLFFVCVMFVNHGPPRDVGEAWFVYLTIATLILNSAALFLSRKRDGWLSLLLKRKALEEQRKIDALVRERESKP
jgi:hypothetical protein